MSAYQHIVVLGCPGSGKTTLARALAKKTGLPLYHLDAMFWKEGWQESTDEEFDERLFSVLAEPRWIIDGNYNRTITPRLDRCDMAIYLDLPRLVCLISALHRVIRNFGKSRPDMGPNCPERFDWEFIRYIWEFNPKNRARYLAMLRGLQGKRVMILHSRRACRKFLNTCL